MSREFERRRTRPLVRTGIEARLPAAYSVTPMMQAILLPPLLLDAFLVSVVLIILNRRGLGVAGAAATTAATSLVLVIAQWLAFGAAGPAREVFQYWLLWVLTPSAAILAVSRIGLFVRRPWLLLLAGPVLFVVTLVFAMIAFNLWSGR